MNLSLLKSPSRPFHREFSDLATQTTNGTTASERGMRELAARVVEIRKERGITQIELAKTLGVTQSMVSRIERGELRLNGEVIVKLAKLYKVSTDELLGVKPISEPQPTISRRWLRRLTMIEKLPKRDQDGLIQTIDRYLKADGKV
jgi:transcriptional regulator with XRE-family HTH domain